MPDKVVESVTCRQWCEKGPQMWLQRSGKARQSVPQSSSYTALTHVVCIRASR